MTASAQIVAQPYSGTPSLNLGEVALLRWGAKHPPKDPNVSFAGKTVLVTGANIGLGLESAVKFAQKGASKVFLGVRSLQRGETAKAEIIRRSGCKEDSIELIQMDLERYDSVKGFVANLEKKTARLDIALLNAGLCNQSYVRSEEGHEMAVQVNVLSTALMAQLLFPLLERTAQDTGSPTHLTFVESAGHREVQREWFTDSLLQATDDATTFDVRRSYMMIKLLGMAVMKSLATRSTSSSKNRQVVVNACCPGLCRTNLGRNFSLFAKIFTAGFQFFTARTAEEGARTLVGATALGWESHGQFWHHDVLFPMSDFVNDEKFMEKCSKDIAAVLRDAGHQF